MGLGTSRKIICVILSVIVAASFAGLIFSVSLSNTVASRSYIEKHLITDEVAAGAEEQLDMKYKTLAAESGIPFRVFETAKSEFPVKKTVENAFVNSFGAEDSTLYTENMANYFTKLCIEYLEGVGLEYESENVERTGEKAARIYSDTLGFHNIASLAESISALRNKCVTVTAVTAAAISICVFAIMLLYNDRKKGATYLLGGAYGGALGVLISSLVFAFLNPGSKIDLEPIVYRLSVSGMVISAFLLSAGIGAISFVALCAAQFIVKKKSKKTVRSIIF